MPTATLADGSTIDIQVEGTGPALLLPVDPVPVEGPQAEELRRWGADPALGRSMIDGLRDVATVVAFGYEAHLLRTPRPDTLTPDEVVADLIAIADAVGASTFAYYGYSWLAMVGLQLAIRTERLRALAMGGYPPIDGPYDEMLRVTVATHRQAVAPDPSPDPSGTDPDGFDWDTAEVGLSEGQTRQFVTLYEALRGFDDRAIQERISIPRLCFVGAADRIEYGERWGGVVVDLADPVARNQVALEALGWEVVVLEGRDHMQAMLATHALPVLRPWLEAR